MNITLLSIDIAKDVFQVCGTDKQGKAVLERRVSRAGLMKLMKELPVCTVAMEACGSAHYWARTFIQLGHTVKLLPPQYVKPFVKRNKNDYRDAQAIAEAATRPDMPLVEPKTVEQQEVQSLLRIRQGYMQMRTKLSNQLRGLLAEYGIVIRVGVSHLKRALPTLYDREADNGLSLLLKEWLEVQYTTLVQFEQRIADSDRQLEKIAKETPACQRLMEIEGVGVLTAVAMIACVGQQGKGFKNGRHFAAYLGLVPKQHSSGHKETLLGISKRGNQYLRELFIHGGRSVVRRADKKIDARSQWITRLKARRGANKAVVAVANKNARIAMALLLSEQCYQQAA